MSGPTLFDSTNNSSNDVVAWLILGYLCSNPEAKDTAEGVEKWWLNDMEINLDARDVQGALDCLVRLGWLVSSERQGTGMVYGLNGDRRDRLRQFLRCMSDLR
jgi:hypothetical protein